jgi:hypothetical protein
MHFAEYSEIFYRITFKEIAEKYKERSFSSRNDWNNTYGIQERKEVLEKKVNYADRLK